MPITRNYKANAIRVLSMDAVQAANSGHPGMPMGMADIAEVLWCDYLRHNPKNPAWANRDRFILSNGHGSMLIYALLHLTGYDLTIDDIKAFRQLHSKTPGHPEYGMTPGVETTTGPLGQGFANAVGMAIAAKHLAARFNRPNFPIIDHDIYCFVGDGCLMEGISHEVASLAGTFKLSNLVVFYDDNGISIDGETKNWFTDETVKRFESYGWQVIHPIDGHHAEAISKAIDVAQTCRDKPTLIICKTTIGYGSPNKAGKAASHGAALGEKEVALVRQTLGWTHPPFDIPADIYAAWDAKAKGEAAERVWNALFADYQRDYPALAADFLAQKAGEMPSDWGEKLQLLEKRVSTETAPMATRKASQLCIEHLAAALPALIGGSADLTDSNCTDWKEAVPFSGTKYEGRYIHFGVREFGMSAIMNGMALYGGLIPFCGTFLTFSDYARNALRLAAIMHQRVVYVYSHDSIGLGEDGPTHQPIEHISSLRLIPNVSVWRPCDLQETKAAWLSALSASQPTALLLSRQNLPQQRRDADQIRVITKGAYVLKDYSNSANPAAILIATGSEVALAMEAAEALAKQGYFVRVVSMPSANVFLAQDLAYQTQVLPPEIAARVAIEAGSTNFWYQFVGLQGKVIGIDHYGASAPAKDVFAAFGFTVDHVVAITKEVIYAAANKAQPHQKIYAT